MILYRIQRIRRERPLSIIFLQLSCKLHESASLDTHSSPYEVTAAVPAISNVRLCCDEFQGTSSRPMSVTRIQAFTANPSPYPDRERPRHDWTMGLAAAK